MTTVLIRLTKWALGIIFVAAGVLGLVITIDQQGKAEVKRKDSKH